MSSQDDERERALWRSIANPGESFEDWQARKTREGAARAQHLQTRETAMRVAAKDRVMNERGITTRVKNASDGKLYWIGTTRRHDGAYVTTVGPAGLFGVPPNKKACDVFLSTLEKESVALHFALEETVERWPRDKWQTHLPEQRLVMQRMLDEAEKRDLL